MLIIKINAILRSILLKAFCRLLNNADHIIHALCIHVDRPILAVSFNTTY